MSKVVTLGVPADVIPERGQDQHGLRLDLALRRATLPVAVLETYKVAPEECRFKCPKPSGVHRPYIRQILQR
jgi:hypothetical protein